MNFFKDFRKRLAWFGILLVAIFLSQTPMLTLAILTKIQFNPIWSTILVSLISILVLAIFLYGAHKSKLLDLKSKLLTINDLPRIVLSYLAIYVGNLVGGIWLQLVKQTTTANQQVINNLVSESSLISSFFLIVLIAPICEEIICRGIIPTKLFQGYEKFGYVIGWLIFLLAHMPSNLPSFLIYGWMSAVLSWTAYRTRRLEMSISVHMLLNSISFILLALFTIFMKNFGI
ncbi:lysostaphin resistance A-like protein [Streptococcus sp. BJSWXB6CM1]|uniref:Lysostaphin resistance A-like protein n=1 Tax=Streptococcus fermentans TaxID=3095082 RepID=A0ABU5G1R3_9STRE|nr:MULTISPECIES: lysostaphin resistance A-like protein [unclassified Streptococcus]MDY4346321.1 lysostaphin resistance A-like protein [Streptococcus sp. BJSWXB5TM5]MDY4361244.1 lysostaphin resistance A-like protein [Streptococcus sp. BJSWXB3CM3]MDY4371401.1 lysostaphin resistance A-like protein [Streptococcus sp. BJSWXB6CM1]